MRKIKFKAIFSMLIVVVMILNLMPFTMIKVLAKEPTKITKIEINNLNLTFNDAMRGTDAKIQVKEYTFPENAYYSRGNDNVWINQGDHGVYGDKLVAGHETTVDIEVFAKQVGMAVENPDYDFDEDHLDQIEVWINGVKRDDVIVDNYNSSWRCVDVYIPATVVEYVGPKNTVSFNTQGGSSVESQQVAEGYYASVPENPTKENEVFTGWYTDPECTDYFYFESNKIMQDTTIYAGWRPRVETQYINKIEFNNLNLELNNSMTGFDAKDQIKQYTFPENAYYSRGNDNVWINQDDHGVYGDKLLAGYETKVNIEVYAKQFGMDVENPDYDFDEDHIDQIEVWINGEKRDDVVVTNYNSSWRCVDVRIPVTVEGSTETKYTVSFETYGGAPVPENQLVLEGKKATKPSTDPQKGSDLVFDGWYTDSGFSTKFDFNTPITQDTTIYAYFKPYDPSAYKVGDINEDGKINADDAANAIEIFKTNAQTPENIAKGDMDGNGKVDAEDSALIIEYFKTHH